MTRSIKLYHTTCIREAQEETKRATSEVHATIRVVATQPTQY